MRSFSFISILTALSSPCVGAFSGRAITPRSFSTTVHSNYAPTSTINNHRVLNNADQHYKKAGIEPLRMATTDNSDNNDTPSSSSCWNPQLRRIVGSMASLGVLETSYLTYTKMTGTSQAFCGPDGGCSSVLSGPYAVIPFTDVPLATLGLAAYSTVALLAFLPLLSASDTISDDTENRIWLTAAVTAMGTFSVFLMSLLFEVLHANCPFCLVSACLSIGMAGIVWIGGAVPEEARKRAVQTSAGSFTTTVLAALVLFFCVDETSLSSQLAAGFSSSLSSSQTFLASSESSEGLKPPPITTSSTERSLSLSKELQSLDATMYGAYWCSHCYDQKLTLGKEAFSKITYVECSKDGYNQDYNLCKKKNVPGYPTWEINGTSGLKGSNY